MSGLIINGHLMDFLDIFRNYLFTGVMLPPLVILLDKMHMIVNHGVKA